MITTFVLFLTIGSNEPVTFNFENEAACEKFAEIYVRKTTMGNAYWYCEEKWFYYKKIFSKDLIYEKIFEKITNID